MQYIRNLINDHHGNFARFAIVGVSNTAIDLALFSILYYMLGFLAIGAHVISFACATINSFVLNKFWTFENKNKEQIPGQFLKFIAVTASALIISSGILWVADQYIWTIAAKILTIGFTMVWNYCGMHLIVFKTNDENQKAPH